MATFGYPRANDPRFFEEPRVNSILSNIKTKLAEKCPSVLFNVNKDDVINLMHKVWRPHAKLDYMQRIVENMHVNNLLTEYMDERSKMEAWNNNHYSMNYVQYDPQSTLGAIYKFPESRLASRPDINLGY